LGLWPRIREFSILLLGPETGPRIRIALGGSTIPTHRIIYSSFAKIPVNLESIRRIADRSILNNSTNQLRGILVATETRFLQVLEGAPEPTRSTYERIAADVRHDQVNLLTNDLVDAASFSRWKMRCLIAANLPPEHIQSFQQKYGPDDRSTFAIPDRADQALALLKDAYALM